MNNQKILVSIVVLVILAGLMLWAYQSQNNVSDSQALTITNFEECKQAGYPIMESYPEQCRTATGELFVQVVGNTDSSDDSSVRLAAGYVAGHITIGPNCGGPEKEGETCVTPPSAYSSREVVVYDNDKVSVNVKGKIDAEGNYKIALGPGNYFVQVVPAGIKAGEKMPVKITSFQTTIVNFNIDTGIR